MAVLVAASLLIAFASRAPAQCVGDCAGDGEVTINDLILGVNIALGSQPVSACLAFANEDDEVTIAQLIRGVNNALEGCPPAPATATATHTSVGATATATNTAPASTPTHTAIPTGTATATVTATATAPPTHTAIPTGTATATLTNTATPTGTAAATITATATAPATSTATELPTATATTVLTATVTEPATATATAEASTTDTVPPSLTATATESATPTPSATPSNTTVPTFTATATPSATPTETSPPPGEQIASRAAFVSAGLGGIQGLIAAVVTAATNDGSALLAGAQGVGPPIDSDQCPISGVTTQSCTEMGSGVTKTINLVLGADACVAPGPVGGTAEFDGSISIASSPFFLNDCSPLVFLGGTFDVDTLMVVVRDAMDDIALTVTANLEGSLNITGAGGSCLVTSLSLTVLGEMTSMLPDGTAVKTSFFDTGVTMTNITYNSDCVPLAYTLTFNGNVAFTPMQGALLEVSAPLTTISGSVLDDETFGVTFTNFSLKQDATTSPVQVEMDGTMTSLCFGGQLLVDTVTPIAVAAGELCPSSGAIAVTGGGNSMATVSYDDGAVTITPQGGQPTNYPSCLTPELLMCAPA